MPHRTIPCSKPNIPLILLTQTKINMFERQEASAHEENSEKKQGDVSDEVFRSIMSRFATGVVVVTTRMNEKVHGSTVQAFCSVSLKPQLVLVSLNSEGRTFKYIKESGFFAVNILQANQQELAERFADPSLSSEQRFGNTRYSFGSTGSPIISECSAYVECRVHSVYLVSDHALVLGEAVAGSTNQADPEPLIYHRSRYSALRQELLH
jgi:flavin reductase (DIM6/NTAB) family NADH-FMN oxidoreductase RutF